MKTNDTMEEKKVSKYQGKVLALFVTSILFLFFFNFNLTSAAQPINPTTQVSTIGNLQLETPPLYLIKQGQTHRFHVHVINATRAKTNLTTQCFLHVYDSQGFDLTTVPQNMEFETYNGIDFATSVSGNNFTTLGNYGYVIQCNSTNEVGFINGQLLVTPSGEDTNDNTLFILIIVTIGLITLGLAIKDEWVAALGGFAGIGIGLYIFINGIGIHNTSTTDMVGIIVIFFSAYVAIRSTLEAIDK